MPYQRRASSPIAAKGELGLRASVWKPGGSASIRSPWLIQTSCSRGVPANSDAIVEHLDRGRAELALGRRRDLAAQRVALKLHPIADAQHRQIGPMHPGRQLRRARLIHAGRAAGEDQPARVEPAHRLLGRIAGDKLAIDAQLAHAPHDQLGRLAAEVEHRDGLCHNIYPD